MIVNKIISGGQTGADQGGLEAGEVLHISTGGTAPKGWRTLNGPNPELGTRFGLVESSSESYVPRTADNVRNSDGTIRFAKDFGSPGERCTLRYINMFSKPHIDVYFNCANPNIKNPTPKEIREWIVSHGIKTLNVAGNSEQRAPGIKKFVIEVLIRVLKDDSGI